MKKPKPPSSPTPDTFDPSRRRLLAGIAASTAGAAALAACGGSSSGPDGGTGSNGGPAGTTGGGTTGGGSGGTSTGGTTGGTTTALPDPSKSGIDHIVVVMMENRSFDHYLGWLPGADGMQAGRNFVDHNGAMQASYHLADFQNCSSSDPDHSFEGGRIELNNGTTNGFLLTNNTKAGDTFPIGYFEEADLPFIGPAARGWTVCDRYFCSILAETYPNRFYMHSGQTDRLHNSDIPSGTASTLPTVWDALKSAGLTGHYFYSDIPFTALWNTKYQTDGTSLPFATFQAMAAAGELPPVSYIDPTFLGEGSGISHDDHPLADIRNGQYFLNQVYNAVTQSPNWANTLLIVTYDEWGGFAEHVVPPFGPVTAAEAALVGTNGQNQDGRMGFRVPNLLIGPRARRGYIDHQQYDHTSVLNLICWRFGLTPWYPRGSTSNNIAVALDFTKDPDTSAAPTISAPMGPFGTDCNPTSSPLAVTSPDQAAAAAKTREAHLSEMRALKALAEQNGFTVY